MTARLAIALAIMTMAAVAAEAQAPRGETGRAAAFVDPVSGLSLEDAVARAMTREPALGAARQQVAVAHGERRQAGLRPNPSLAFEQRTEPGGTDRLTMVTVEWPLDLFRRGAREAVADARVVEAAHAVADRERVLAGEVRAAYGAVLAAVRDLEVLDQLAVTTRTLRDLVAAQVEEGRAPALDRDAADVELGRLEADRLLVSGAAEAALASLKRLLGMPNGEPLTLRATLDALVAAETGATPAAAAATPRADIREAEARVAVAEAAIAKAESEGRADLGVYGTYMRMDGGFPQSGFAPGGGIERVRAVFHYVAGGVRVTLPFRNRNQGMTEAAVAGRSAAQSALEAARLAAEAERSAAIALDRRARDAVGLYRDGLLALAGRTLAAIEQSHALGRGTLVDVLDARRRYLEVERGYSEALRAAFDARTALLLATGVGQ